MSWHEHIDESVLEQYQVIRKVGQGAYGQVWKAKCKHSNRIVALKKIFDAFQHSTDAQRTFREISVLRQLQHPHIVPLYTIHDSPNNRDIYLVFEYMESDLYHLIYEGKLQKIHIKYILYQIVKALHYLHSSSLIHRDLKPSNILINSDCLAKVCDFGLVRLMEEKQSLEVMTQGVATRWYRAPEVLLGSHSYDWKADMWSVGCIAAQMILKSPLFPGKCTPNQLQRILQFTGKPSSSEIASLKAQLASVMISEMINTVSNKPKKNQIFSNAQDEKLVDLIQKLLQFSPDKRPTARQALQHPYFEDFFNHKDLSVMKERISLLVSENKKLKTDEYIKLIREKFICKAPRDSTNCRSKKVSQSPKTFSDIKKNRKRSSCTGSKPKSAVDCSNEKKQRTCTLFQQLCRQKSCIMTPSNKKQTIVKHSSRKKIQNKENMHQNQQNRKQQEIHHRPIARLNEKYLNNSFNGLRKGSKIPR